MLGMREVEGVLWERWFDWDGPVKGRSEDNFMFLYSAGEEFICGYKYC